jgi:hypothetical protein
MKTEAVSKHMGDLIACRLVFIWSFYRELLGLTDLRQHYHQQQQP